MDSDYDYLCFIHNQKDILLIYHCLINKVQTIFLLDTDAIKNYISRKLAEKANLKFRRCGAQSNRSVKLPNGQKMKILGKCEFNLTMSKWTDTVVATVFDLNADFDVVLGMQ